MNALSASFPTILAGGLGGDALGTAEAFAPDVDRYARFPAETIAALRSTGALGWLVPTELGGGGASFPHICETTFQLARRCSSSAMIFAMHQIQVASLVRHGAASSWFRSYLTRVAQEQRLIASATSEAGVGGEIRRSIAALTPDPDTEGNVLRFEKHATTISYGAYADDVLTTVRRSPAADPGDQVLVLTRFSEMQTEQKGEWDTLGMRGTCSPGFLIRARFPAEQVLPGSFSNSAAETMVPVSHLLWAHLWMGIAADAFERAQNFVRFQARQQPGTVPPAASVLSLASLRMAEMRALIRSALEEYERAADEPGRPQLSTVGYALRINQLKIVASETAADVCSFALRICGFAGYQNTGPFSVGRQLRDSLSAALMVANDRLHATNSSLLLVHRETR